MPVKSVKAKKTPKAVKTGKFAKAKSTDHDSPWKKALDNRFAEFLELLFPDIYREIDWSWTPEFLDKELQRITRDAETGRRYADKLVKVRNKKAQEVWVLIHVEVQGDADAEFAERMYVYNYRIFDWHRVNVASLGVLADTSDSFRPSTYQRQCWGTSVDFRFPVVKLIDWESRWEELENSNNVFALVVMAQIKAKTSRTAIEMKDWKLHLVRLMYQKGYSKATMLELFHIIDWMITLPKGLEKQFQNAVYHIEKEKKMPHVTSFERMGEEKGIRKAVISLIHNAKKEGLSEDVIARITSLDMNMVKKILDNKKIKIPVHLLQQAEQA